MENRLYRSRTDRMLLGVCGGLGKYLGVDSTIIRIVFVLLAFCAVGIVAYIVIGVIAPLEETQKTSPHGVLEENVNEIKDTATKFGNEIRDVFAGKGTGATGDDAKEQARRRNALGMVIIIIGVICLLSAFHIFSWFNWWGGLGALALIGLGVLLIVGDRRGK
jgi:phage shock protein PspC (stress-responsive transcriptional regulator)